MPKQKKGENFITINLKDGDHKKLKLISVKADKSIQEIAETLIKGFIKKKGSK